MALKSTSLTAEGDDELCAELMTHAAVDDEVERITERDEHVDEQCRDLARLGVEKVHLKRVVDDEE